MVLCGQRAPRITFPCMTVLENFFEQLKHSGKLAPHVWCLSLGLLVACYHAMSEGSRLQFAYCAKMVSSKQGSPHSEAEAGNSGNVGRGRGGGRADAAGLQGCLPF